MERTIDIQLLGSFRITVADDRTVTESDWDRTRSRQLVQLLALSSGHRLVRDQVIDTLWPDLDADAGGANLRKAAHHARAALGDPQAVVLRGGQVALFPDDTVHTDLETFEAAARDALRSKDPVRCSSVADGCGGTLLPASPYDEWTVETRRSTAATHLELLRVAGRWSDVVAHDPADEDAYRHLMADALADGRRAEAIQWFGGARTALANELGMAPGPELEALHAEAVAGLDLETTVPIGRDLEVARAIAALRHGSDGAIRAVAVRGPAGIGKSVVVRSVVDAIRDDGVVIHELRATDPHRPYGPLVDLIERILLEHRGVLAELRPQTRAVVAALTATFDGPPLQLPLTRHQVVGAVTDVLRGLAGTLPSLLVADDLHEADDASVDALAHLAWSADAVAVVVAYRPESARRPLQAAMDGLERTDHLLALDLTALSPAQAEQICRSVVGALAAPVLERIVTLAAGNPFALVELTRATTEDDGPLPRSTAEAITNRLVDLDPDTMAMLERIALATTDLDSATVAALATDRHHDPFALLDRALDAGVLVVRDERYRFRHDLVRDALATLVPPHRRLDVHRHAAQRLVDLGAAPAAIAEHWVLAEDHAAATPWCIEAAQEALGVGAFLDARRHVARVLQADPLHPDALRIEAECLDMLGNPAALPAYDAAIAVAGEEIADDLVVNRALAQIKQGDPAGGLRAIRGARPRTPMGRINEALAYAGAAALGATDPAVGTEKAAECRRLALETGDRGAIVIAAWAHAAAAHARGDLHDSVLADLRETKDLPELAVRVFDGHLCMTQRFLYGSRPYAEVISFADELTAEAERLAAARGRAFGITLRGEARFLSGQVAEAEEDLHRAVGLHRETGGTTGEAHAVQRLAEIAHAAGDVHASRARIGEALALARSSDIGFHLLDRIYGSRISFAATPAEALAAVEEAEEAVRGPLETCPGCRVHLAVPAAIASARAGDLDRAHSYAEAVDYLADVVMRLPAWFASRDEVQANLAVATGDPARAATRFAAAADGFTAAGQPVDADRCRRAAAVV